MKIQEGERLKYGYGFAWRCYETMESETFLIPFNIIFRKIRELYLYLQNPRYKEDVYENGYSDGCRRARLENEKQRERDNEEWSKQMVILYIELAKLKGISDK